MASSTKSKEEGDASPSALGEAADQSTKKISASELAAVLARVDGPKRQRSDAPPSAPHTLAVVERPVAERKVVNATTPEAPTSSGQLPVAERASAPDSSPPNMTDAAPSGASFETAPSASAAPSEAEPAPNAAPSLPVRAEDLPLAQTRWQTLLLLVLLGVAIAAALHLVLR